MRLASAVGLLAALSMAASPVLAASRVSFSSPSRSFSSPSPSRSFSSPSPSPSRSFSSPSPSRVSFASPAAGPAQAPTGGATRVNFGSQPARPATAAPGATRVTFAPSPTASRFAASPQYRSYTTHVHVYHYTAGGYYHYHYPVLVTDPYYGMLHYGSVYHYGAYDYMPILAAAGVLTAIMAVDTYGNQHRIDCNAPYSQADFDTCASARQSMGIQAAYSAPQGYAAPAPAYAQGPAYAPTYAAQPTAVVVHRGIGLGGWIIIILLVGGLGIGGIIAARRFT